MQLALYFAPFSCAFVPYVLLTQAGAEFETRPINIRGKENMSPEYLALNPKHKVPLLLVDGNPLSENVAIQLWIARTFRTASILPTDPWENAQAVSLCAWFAAGIHPCISRYNAPLKFCDHPGSEAATKRLAADSLLEQLAIADKRLEGREFFFEQCTAPDIYLHWCFRRSSYFDIDLTGFKNIARHSNRLQSFESIQHANKVDAEFKAMFGL